MYRIVLTLEGTEIEIPVLPKTVEVQSRGRNERAEIINLGEVSLLRPKGLREISWKSFFPAHMAPYVNGYSNISSVPVLGAFGIQNAPTTPAITIVRALQKQRDLQEPLYLTLIEFDLDVNMLVGIEDFRYEEKHGEVGDIYYSIRLKEWIDTSPSKIKISGTQQNPIVEIEEPKRTGTPSAAIQKGTEKDVLGRVYTVQPGESLWQIAKQIYDDGNRYLEIYNYNKKLIDTLNFNKDTFKYAIVAGMELIVP